MTGHKAFAQCLLYVKSSVHISFKIIYFKIFILKAYSIAGFCFSYGDMAENQIDKIFSFIIHNRIGRQETK